MKYRGFLKIVSVLLILVFLANTELWSQCPMCRIAAESNLRAGGTAGKGLNAGILYMLSAPYLLVATITFIWWRLRRKDLKEERELELMQ